jgi:hypothetical protein
VGINQTRLIRRSRAPLNWDVRRPMNVREASNAAVSKYIEAGTSSLSQDELMMVAIWGLEADVNNGGFDQYYLNSYGDFAVPVVGFLRTIGAQNMAQLVEEANSRFSPSGPPANWFERQEALNRLPGIDHDLWGDLDAAFWKYPDQIEALLAKYLGLADA